MAWDITGNSGTNPNDNFLGTIDSEPLVIRTNNTEHLRVDTNGNVGIGTTSPSFPLHVENANARFAIYSHSDSGNAVYAASNTGIAVVGWARANNLDPGLSIPRTPVGVYGESLGTNGVGVMGKSHNAGVMAFNFGNQNAAYLASGCCAAYLVGEVAIIGHLSKSSGGFLIDHPLDPANMYLSHSFVESPEMKNIYDGVVVIDGNGEAMVELPAWFEAINTDFRYQLTCIGGYAPVYIAQELRGNCFKIAGGTPSIRVSWQLTGIRQDVWANAHRIRVEEEKSIEERGNYLHPELHGAPNEKSIERVRHPTQQQSQQTRSVGGLNSNVSQDDAWPHHRT